MAKRKTTKKSAARKPGPKKATKNSLVGNINRRKKAGTSRSKQESSISEHAYSQMQEGWPQDKTKKGRKKAKK